MLFWEAGIHENTVEQRFAVFFLCCACGALFSSCKKPVKAEENQNRGIILGFSQIGAESAWRIRNTRSVQEAAGQLARRRLEELGPSLVLAYRSFFG
jgi:simple sugar transport system substrate-binding protein